MFHAPDIIYLLTHTYSFAEIPANWSTEQTPVAPTARALAPVSGTETGSWRHSAARATTTTTGTGNPDPFTRGQWDE